MKILLKNCKIVDIKKNIILDRDILIDNGIIVEINESNKEYLREIKTIDVNNNYVLPGLINLHVHLFGTGKPSKVLGGGKSQERLIKFVHTWLGKKVLHLLVSNSAKTELYSGVTTLRSVGDFLFSDVYIRDKINNKKKIGSRILCSGPAITVPGGHGDGTFSVTGTTESELKALVRENAKHKVDWIKICVTGGVMDAKKLGEPGEVKMSLEQVKWVCDEAHRLGYRVASHTESPEGLIITIKGGVDTVEHGAILTPEDAKILKERNGALVPTFTPAFPLANLDSQITKLNDMAKYNTNIVLTNMIKGVNEAKQFNINIGCGTDASCPLCTQYGFYRELIYQTKCLGYNNNEALLSGTLINAKILEMDDKIGSIDINKYADLIVVKDNPLENLSSLKNPVFVMKDGVIYKNKPKKNRFIETVLDNLIKNI